MRVEDNLPIGEKWDLAIKEFNQKYHSNPSLLEEVQKLLSLTQRWDFHVFLELAKRQEKMAIEEVIKRLDREVAR